MRIDQFLDEKSSVLWKFPVASCYIYLLSCPCEILPRHLNDSPSHSGIICLNSILQGTLLNLFLVTKLLFLLSQAGSLYALSVFHILLDSKLSLDYVSKDVH